MEKVADNVGGTNLGRPYSAGSYSIADTDAVAFTQSTPKHPADVAIASRGSAAERLTHLNNDLLDHRTLGDRALAGEDLSAA